MYGAYDTITKQIHICDSSEKEFATYHEVGHYYWHNHLTKKEKQKYIKEFNKAKSFFREYSSTDYEEDFADAYASKVTWTEVVGYKINLELRKRQKLTLKLISNHY